MSSNIVNSTPFLRTSRNFPEDDQALSVEITKTYIDIANAVNARTIGIYTLNQPSVTGESWFIVKAQKQQTLRQVYTFTAAGNITHNLKFASISAKSYGSFTDGTSWYGTIYASNTAIAGQVSFYVTSTDIIVLSGAGAPTITSGTIVIEFLVNV